jgi:hypothetical protein
VADQLLQMFGVVEARQIFGVWASQNAKTQEEIDTAFAASASSKEFLESRQDKTKKPEPITARELRSMDLPPQEWIISKILPKGALVAISGVPGSFKSFFTLWSGLRAAEGLPLFEELDEPFFCEQKTVKTPTLFIEEENSLPEVYKRLRSLKTPVGDNLFFHVDQGFKMCDESWRNSIVEFVESKKIGLIIMDPFSSVMGLVDENNNAEVAETMDLMRKTFIKRGVTVVFIHHPAKGDGTAKNLRGAGDILGKCDMHLHLEKDKKDKKQVNVSYEKVRLVSEDEVSNFKMRIAGDGLNGELRFRYLGRLKSKTQLEHEELAEEIKALMTAGENYGKSELSKEVGTNFRTVKFKEAWKILLGSGQIEQSLEKKNGHHLFHLVNRSS